jgi:dTDP-4-amino-4,6-dideoxygalactose transaminase
MLRDWGAERKYYHALKGYNYRMEGIQGAVLRVKLRHLDRWNEARRERATLYAKLLEDVTLPGTNPGVKHAYCVFTIFTQDRQFLADRLKSQEIQFAIHYPVPIHLMEAHADLGHREGDFPCSERTAELVLCLPIYPEMPLEHVEIVSSAIRSCESH